MTRDELVQLARFRFEKQPEIRAEFGDVETYVHYSIAEQAGWVKSYKKGAGLSKTTFNQEIARELSAAMGDASEQIETPNMRSAKAEWNTNQAMREAFDNDFDAFFGWWLAEQALSQQQPPKRSS